MYSFVFTFHVILYTALPIFFENQVYWYNNSLCNGVILNWNNWHFGRDYGVGPVHGYNLYYRRKGSSQRFELRNLQSGVEIWNLVSETEYEFEIVCLQNIEGTLTAGPAGDTLSFKTGCGSKSFCLQCFIIHNTFSTSYSNSVALLCFISPKKPVNIHVLWYCIFYIILEHFEK